MGALPPKFYKNCIKSRGNARFSCKTPKIWRYFCAFLLLDKRQFDRPTMVDYAGISIKSTVRINKFQIAVLCNLHKKSRNLGPDPTLHHICSSSYCRPRTPARTGIPAAETICKFFRGNSTHEAHMAVSRKLNLERLNLTKNFFYGIIFKKGIFKRPALPGQAFAEAAKPQTKFFSGL